VYAKDKLYARIRERFSLTLCNRALQQRRHYVVARDVNEHGACIQSENSKVNRTYYSWFQSPSQVCFSAGTKAGLKLVSFSAARGPKAQTPVHEDSGRVH